MSPTTTNPAGVVHDTFVLEREYPAPAERVYAAFADLETKQRWFKGPDEWSAGVTHTMDFRVGGHEHEAGGPPEGPLHVFDATYLDIVPDERIIYSYSMAMDDERISVSLATIELLPTATGTRLRLTEHGAYFDGEEGARSRREGTEQLLEAVATLFEED